MAALQRHILVLLLALFFATSFALADDRPFSLPLKSLKEWSENIVVRLPNVTIKVIQRSIRQQMIAKCILALRWKVMWVIRPVGAGADEPLH